MSQRAIRVCYLIDRLLPAGTESQLVALIRHLDRSKVEPSLCLLDGEDDLSRSLEPDCCPVMRLGVRRLRHPSTLAKAWRLARFLREQDVDVLQIYFPDSTYLGVPVARMAGVPYVVRTRNNLGYWMTPVHQRLSRVVNHFVDAMVANCDACRRAVRADEGPLPRRIEVLENGVDLARFPPRGDSARAKSSCRVGVVANLRPVKSLDVFVRAAARIRVTCPGVRFQIAGEGESRPALENLIKELGLASCFGLLGSVSDVSRFLDKLDVAVLPSRSEGMSNALLEYMAAGKAIVATAVGGTRRLLEDGVHGLLVPPDDVQKLSEAVCRLLDDADLAGRLGVAARRRVENQYSREAMVRRFEEFYQGLVRGVTRRAA